VFDGSSSLLTPGLLRELYGVGANEILADSAPAVAAPAQVHPHPLSWSAPLVQAA
jgi:phosphonate transport system ATP-binding protein